jgi:predicted GIY-YIG superfamily endonuclease
MMCNAHKKVLYIGVTNDLERRVQEHKRGEISGFTQKYNVSQLARLIILSAAKDFLSLIRPGRSLTMFGMTET